MSSAAFGLQTVALALACGYLLHETPVWRRQFREYTGHVLYFRVAVIGLLWLSLCDWLLPFFVEKSIFSAAVPLFSAFLFLLATAGLQNLIFRLRPEKRIKLLLRSFAKEEKLFERHIMQALATNTQVMVTMDSGKVYAGLVVAARLQSSEKWLTLFPTISGYRNEKSKQVFLETDYSLLREEAAKNHPDLKFDVTLPVDKIASLQFFDARYFNPSSDDDDEKQPAAVSGS